MKTRWRAAASLYVLGFALTVGLSAGAGTALASDKLLFAAEPAWVHPILPATAVSDDAHATYAVLNRTLQTRFGDDADQVFMETMVQIQTPKGLDIGRPTVEWDPQDETVTINKVQLIRDGQVIDLLAQGQTFTMLRREADLDNGMINGRLTAILEPDGLRVGDILDFAYTRSRHLDVLGTRSEDYWINTGNGNVGKRYYRFIWPAGKPMRWRISDDLPAPDLVTSDGETEMTINLDHYIRPANVDLAPERFNNFGEIQFSQFKSWTEVSALQAPFYSKAATLNPNSPLKAEAAKIRALGDDPKAQAAAALHLVENSVRYVYVRANDGGYVPPDADLTWARRWGDCKAKTVLLIALLRELGITADPALVETEAGDGMNERLPALALFDHIIVRASIGGKAYWLDGTHDVDGSLDDLSTPNFKWVLPLTAAGEELQPLAPPPLARPAQERSVRLDASGGLSAPVHAHVEFIEHGNYAWYVNLNWQAQSPDDADAKIRAYWKTNYPSIDIDSVTQTFDPAAAEMRYDMDGTAHMRWQKSDDGRFIIYEADGDDLGQDIKLPVRKPGALHADAPVAVDYPAYVRSTETIILPTGAQDFDVAADTVDATIEGRAMTRTGSIDKGVFHMETTERTLSPEIPLADAKATADALKAVANGGVYLISAVSETAPDANGVAVAKGAPAAGTGDGQRTVDQDILRLHGKTAGAQPKAATPGDTGRTTLTPDDLARFYSGQ